MPRHTRSGRPRRRHRSAPPRSPVWIQAALYYVMCLHRGRYPVAFAALCSRLSRAALERIPRAQLHPLGLVRFSLGAARGALSDAACTTLFAIWATQAPAKPTRPTATIEGCGKLYKKRASPCGANAPRATADTAEAHERGTTERRPTAARRMASGRSEEPSRGRTPMRRQRSAANQDKKAAGRREHGAGPRGEPPSSLPHDFTPLSDHGELSGVLLVRDCLHQIAERLVAFAL